MNQKGLANIILIVLVVILVGALGYVTLVKKSTPLEQPPSNNLQNTQTTTSPPTNNTVSQNQPPTDSGKELSGLVSITLPSYCNFTLDTPAGSSVSGEKGWIIDCGRSTKNAARGFMREILEPQGWKFCDSGLANAHWWKNGVITGVVESENSNSAASYPFSVNQREGTECQSQ